MAYPYFWLLQIGDDEEEEGGEEGEEGEAEEKMPTCGDYIMHFLTLFWKILFAFIPPAGELYLISAGDCNIFKSMPSAALCLFSHTHRAAAPFVPIIIYESYEWCFSTTATTREAGFGTTPAFGKISVVRLRYSQEKEGSLAFILREINQNILTALLGLHGGYITFTVSIITIGMITAVIGDVASHLGCFIFLKDTVNAIAFVALGTSVPGNCETVFSRD